MAGNSAINVGFGTSGQVLLSNGPGTLPTFQSISGGGALIFLQTQTVSSVTAVNFTTGISSTYNNYLLIMKNGTLTGGALVGGNPSVFMLAQLSTNGGSSYITSNYASFYSSAGSSGLQVLAAGAAGTGTFWGAIEFGGLTSANNYPMAAGNGAVFIGATRGGFTGNGIYKPGSVATNALRIVMSDGSVFSGIFSLYAYAQ